MHAYYFNTMSPNILQVLDTSRSRKT